MLSDHLTNSGTRAVAAAELTAANPLLPLPHATLLVDLLDGLTYEVLVDTAGLTPNDARTVLATLWTAR